ncbi:MAG: hypothetical protein FWH20_06945 [Oscillospiraceae bacterium]|nr:hypothetical protein [Oscillospiraceae bacterium]
MADNTPERASGKRPVIKRTVYLRVIWVLLGLFFLITVVSQFYIRFFESLQTEVAMMYKSPDEIVFKGVHIRNEKQLRYGGADVVAYIHEDGSKLGSNPVVARSYKSVEDILIQGRIDQLSERAAILEDAAALASTDNSLLESFNNQITIRHTQLLSQLNEGDYYEIDRLKNDYLSLQAKKQLLRNDEGIDYRAQINSIYAEISRLRASMSALPRNVSIDEAGYFVSVVDGREDSLNFDKVSALQKSDIEQIIRQPTLDVPDDVIGKMIDGYKWRFVGIFDTERTRRFYPDLVLEFRIGANPQTVQATIIGIKRLDDGSSIITFECDTLTAEFASRRVSQFSLSLDSHSGIRIRSESVHFNEDNEPGVFVQHGVELVFRKIKEIRSENDFIIVEDTTDLPGYISLYDNVVVRGRDLYEGKIVR